jgi:FkbM family methyltransferase
MPTYHRTNPTRNNDPMATPSLETQLDALLGEDFASAIEREKTTFDELTAPFGRRLVLFGAGNLGRKVLRVLRSQGIEPLAFADDTTTLWGTKIDGVPVLSPVAAADQFGRSAAFVVTIFTRGSNLSSLRMRLLELSCVKVVPFLSLLWKYPHECLPHMAVDLPHRILRQKDDVRDAFILLGDDVSRREYVTQVRWRLLQDFDVFLPPISQEQYFPDDLFTLVAGEVFVDCGAFDGDTIRAIIKRRPDFGRIVALEPDPTNFQHLEEYLSELPSLIRDRISPLRLALGAVKGKVRFEAAGTEGSKISEQGEVEVECDVLDDLLDGCIPTYIKMDIEGAESDALRGATRVIHQNSAIWAVCLYHKPEDLWRVPLLINSCSDGYSFFLRKYQPEVWESVCYAVPSKRL